MVVRDIVGRRAPRRDFQTSLGLTFGPRGTKKKTLMT